MEWLVKKLRLRLPLPVRVLWSFLRRLLLQLDPPDDARVPPHLLPEQCSLQLRRMDRLVKKLRLRLPHPVRVVWSYLRRQLHQPPGDELVPPHLLPEQCSLQLRRLEWLVKNLRLRLPHPVRVVWSFLRRQLHQPPVDELVPPHLLPAQRSLQLRWMDRLVKNLRRRHPHPDRVVWSYLRRQLHQPPGDERLAQHLLPAQRKLRLQWLGWLVKNLRRRHPHPD